MCEPANALAERNTGVVAIPGRMASWDTRVVSVVRFFKAARPKKDGILVSVVAYMVTLATAEIMPVFSIFAHCQ